MLNRRFVILFFSFLIVTLAGAQSADEYYSNKLDGKKDKELKTILHVLLKEHKRIPYGSAYGSTWTVFRKSDVRPDGSIWDMYSSVKRYFPSGSTGSNREMNIEHSAAKSWWGESSNSRDFQYAASFDLHHLVPSDAEANTAKSNYVLGEVESAAFNNGVSKVGTTYIGKQAINAFEPADEYKGDFARMYFYMATCYQDYSWGSSGTKIFLSNDYPSLTNYAKDLLLKWHRKDPVSQKEITRNEAVYSFQLNRNPYIDYPELAEYIWGNKVSQAFYLTDNPYLLSHQSGDKIELPDCKVGKMVSKVVTLKGKSFISDVYLTLSGEDFTISTTRISPENLNNGVDITLSYSPTKGGLKKAELLILGGGLMEAIKLDLHCLSIPEKIERLFPLNLKSTYQVTDPIVLLQLNNTSASLPCIWSGKGISYNNGNYIFEPKAAGQGEHFLYWSMRSAKGKIRIVVK